MAAYARSWVIEKAAEKAAGICPCKGCDERKPSCAGFCQKYKDWRQRVSDNLREMRERDRGEREVTAYQRESYDKAVKGHEVSDVKWGNRNRNHNRYT